MIEYKHAMGTVQEKEENRVQIHEEDSFLVLIRSMLRDQINQEYGSMMNRKDQRTQYLIKEGKR